MGFVGRFQKLSFETVNISLCEREWFGGSKFLILSGEMVYKIMRSGGISKI